MFTQTHEFVFLQVVTVKSLLPPSILWVIKWRNLFFCFTDKSNSLFIISSIQKWKSVLFYSPSSQVVANNNQHFQRAKRDAAWMPYCFCFYFPLVNFFFFWGGGVKLNSPKSLSEAFGDWMHIWHMPTVCPHPPTVAAAATLRQWLSV